mmetsp:Transcript_12414/g.18299  ORF Transcript_12414/g.18299 Transcript_12414/m.18299 type:complete len:179 (-) Transcript_12414:4-540(-)|eukprot:CAMPEP_0113933896 /NCGR_PEP_ID=MMETSP1339-20121228/1233_1 /TAXON_ID=94617 /ORGANISM="Fibrocapsa japonica" /LENGTH=178 /DNA_ID=CAMNT_0000935435 /DNA_START=60 /DNA_END=596 /DNA_ORIENTATION=+ /assembly_acc=CAM_ASM_000762
MKAGKPTPTKWNFDIVLGKQEKSALKTFADPPGFSRSTQVDQEEVAPTGQDAAKKKELMQKRAMEMAMAPGKNLAMQAFMMWMSGAHINIFSILMTGMALFNPAKAILSVNQTFAKLDDGKVDLLIPKIVFILVNLAGIGTGVYKCGTMGLLPVTSADWTSYLHPKEAMEFSGVPLSS